MIPHKWAKEIKAWADGADIEQRCHSPSIKEVIWSNWEQFDGEWTDEKHWEYRIKPQEQQSGCCCKQTCSAPKEPQYLYVYKSIPDNYGNGTTEVKISTVKVNNKYYLGKIRLEQDE
jgi:hypothetical protein